MKRPFFRPVFLGWLALVVCGSAARAETIQLIIPPGYHQRQLGWAKLDDPAGTAHSRMEVAGKVVVIIFSVPSLSQGGRQERWAGLLADNPKTKISNDVALVLVEDMSQAGMFKDEARRDMKKEFEPGSRPLLILDETGAMMKRYGIPRNRTVILIYDKTGTLRDVETDLDDQAQTLHRIKGVTRQLLAE